MLTTAMILLMRTKPNWRFMWSICQASTLWLPMGRISGFMLAFLGWWWWQLLGESSWGWTGYGFSFIFGLLWGWLYFPLLRDSVWHSFCVLCFWFCSLSLQHWQNIRQLQLTMIISYQMIGIHMQEESVSAFS